MDRRTTHSPRTDDQLAHEEHALLHGAPDEGRDEGRRSEGPGPDEGGTGTRPEVEEARNGAPPQSEVEDRAAFAATFPPSLFPAWRDELIDAARGRYGSDLLLARLEQLPDRIYESSGDAWREISIRRSPR
jgi:hypothetical protein